MNIHDKEQLKKIEENDTKVDKKEKRKKRLETMGIKVDDADADSELSDQKEEDDDDDEEGGEKKKKTKEHAPIKKTDE